MLWLYLIIVFEALKCTISYNNSSCLSTPEENFENLKESIKLCLNNLNRCSTTGVMYRPQSNNIVNVTNLNECEPNPCVHSTGCIDGANDYMCTCLPGYTGKNCEADINECSSDTDNCDTNAVCTNTVGSFTCFCNAGYAGNGRICSDINECSANADNCDRNAICTNTVGSFTCSCKAGYAGDGISCTDINECSSNAENCDTNAVCTNTVGSFTCSCKAGYVGDGRICSVEKEIYICEEYQISLTCPNNKTISIKDASYGRSDRNTCSDFDHAIPDGGCHASSSFTIVSNLCNSKSSCFLESNNDVFGDPCKGTYKYLYVVYTCK